jgi:hypothetical protein
MNFEGYELRVIFGSGEKVGWAWGAAGGRRQCAVPATLDLVPE